MIHKPSINHPNRRAYNWLVYDSGDRFLISHKKLFKGILYDLGCGQSPFRNWLLQYAESYIGVDWAESLHKTDANIVANLNQTLPISDEVADTVVSLSVLEHLSEPQIMLSESFRILKRGGTIVLQVPWQWPIHEAPYDFFRYTPYGLTYLLEKAGFCNIVVCPQAGFFSMITIKLNYFSLRFIRGPRIVRYLVRGILGLIWHFSQFVAPYLDRFDKNWSLETIGYYVTANKPKKLES